VAFAGWTWCRNQMYNCTLLIMLRGGGVVLGSRFWPKQI
jgi:hypothetical protein